ncbi:hypothetical protein H2203_005238 [Taxawa tesnikishii (nom. ined.)]|nr:hypothetical protein H2203_005238 [Dothideales sp. JES 119]
MSEPELQNPSMQPLSSIPTRTTAHLPVAIPSQSQYDLYAQMQHRHLACPKQFDGMLAHWHDWISLQHYHTQYDQHSISSMHPSLAAQPSHQSQQSFGCDNLGLGPSSYQTAEPEAALGCDNDENNDTVGTNIVFDVMSWDVA